MIYLTEKSNSIEISKHTASLSDAYTLKLINHINNEEWEFPGLVNIDVYNLLYRFEGVDFKVLVPGEYEYALYDSEGTRLEGGIVVYGDYKNDNIQYHRVNKNIQYEG